MSTKVVSPALTQKWASHPAYTRYWQHYHQAMAWMHGHQLAYWKAVEACQGTVCHVSPKDTSPTPGTEDGNLSRHFECPKEPDDPQHGYSPCPWGEQSLLHYGDPLPPSSSSSSWSSTSSLSSSWSSSSDSEELECDISTMEITQELRDYFAQTEKHQEERRLQQEIEEKRLEDYVDADHDLYCNRHPRSVEPPSHRVWERRLVEMKRLYGDSASKIQALEATLQRSFDTYCDQKQPKYWPVIPFTF